MIVARLPPACAFACGLSLFTVTGAIAQVRDSQDAPLTATDGTVFVVTSAVVRVPELRSDGPATRRSTCAR